MDKIQTIKERIFIFLDKEDIKRTTFYKETGMSSSNFKGVALKSDLGVEKLAKILTVYPELKEHGNLNWLITGNGNLDLSQKKDQQTVDLQDENNSEKLGDLLANMYAQYDTVDKGLSFIQKKIAELEKKYDKAIAKQNKDLEEILTQTKGVVK
ncbi:hypothetical protein NZD88_20650 [Chryseobacterium antibioticum]|uniref:Uncharacterized protein n=1 Tax=Chryseobacterium pyrolae TaxID=2987481 RepID=A0ABT2IP56_9FLAO|nr:hypothetical protein [Chryseobacterium pyrolae]MCT2409972.1 hypothetical protein [Chryseobacterium pyrolae]